LLSSLKGVDAFGKTMEDVKVKTRTGALCESCAVHLRAGYSRNHVRKCRRNISK